MRELLAHHRCTCFKVLSGCPQPVVFPTRARTSRPPPPTTQKGTFGLSWTRELHALCSTICRLAPRCPVLQGGPWLTLRETELAAQLPEPTLSQASLGTRCSLATMTS